MEGINELMHHLLHGPMHQGTLVQYTPREGEASFPAVVMQEWPDGTLQLYALHFENSHQVRSAHPSQVKPIVDPKQILALLVQYDEHDKRLAMLEQRMSDLIGQIGHVITAKPQQLTQAPPPQAPVQARVESTPASKIPDSNPDALPETGTTVIPEGADFAEEPKSKRKATWATPSKSS